MMDRNLALRVRVAGPYRSDELINSECMNLSHHRSGRGVGKMVLRVKGGRWTDSGTEKWDRKWDHDAEHVPTVSVHTKTALHAYIHSLLHHRPTNLEIGHRLVTSCSR